jgi:hypothetical protein
VSNPILRTSILASPFDDPTALRTYTLGPHRGDPSIRRAEDACRLVDIEPGLAFPLSRSASTNTATGSTAGRGPRSDAGRDYHSIDGLPGNRPQKRVSFRLRAYADRPPLDAPSNSGDTKSIRYSHSAISMVTDSSLRWILMWIGGGPDEPKQ